MCSESTLHQLNFLVQEKQIILFCCYNKIIVSIFSLSTAFSQETKTSSYSKLTLVLTLNSRNTVLIVYRYWGRINNPKTISDKITSVLFIKHLSKIKLQPHTSQLSTLVFACLSEVWILSFGHSARLEEVTRKA